MEILFAKFQDAHSIARIHIDAWRDTYKGYMNENYLASFTVEKTEKFWQEVIRKNQSQLLIARNEENVVGFLVFEIVNNLRKKKMGIKSLYVSPKIKRRGTGSNLIKSALKKIEKTNYDEVFLWVLQKNIIARKFYSKIGFKKDGVQKEINIDSVSTLIELKYSMEVNYG